MSREDPGSALLGDMSLEFTTEMKRPLEASCFQVNEGI